MSHYTITPQYKKSVEVVVDLIRESNNNLESITIRETYRWGKAFVESELDCNLPYADSSEAYGKFDAGESEDADFEDSVALDFEFSETISEEEQNQIRQLFENEGMGWIYDGDHDWQVDDDYVIIYAPFSVQLCEEDGTVIKTVELAPRPSPSTAWPFSKDSPSTED